MRLFLLSYSSEKVKAWRKRTKARINEAMGGKCCTCGYDRCSAALELHHLDPTEKEFPTGGMIASPMSWDKIVAELRKCVLLCSNCHREVHAGVRDIPEDATRFDESFVTYDAVVRPKVEPLRSACPICGQQKPKSNAFVCSPECRTAYRHKIDWNAIDLLEMAKTMNNTEISLAIGVSNVTVSRKLKQLRGDWRALPRQGSNLRPLD